jgi:zinc resistance-associated protein
MVERDRPAFDGTVPLFLTVIVHAQATYSCPNYPTVNNTTESPTVFGRASVRAPRVSLPQNGPEIARSLPGLHRLIGTVNGYHSFARAMVPWNKYWVPRTPLNYSHTTKIWRRGMWKAGLAGALALAIGSSVAVADGVETDLRHHAVTRSEASMSLAQVARLKTVLKLNAAQETLWPAIEHAFREIKEAQEGSASQGLVQGLKNRAAAIGLNALAMQRLASAAYPLIRTLNEEQKQSGLSFARSVGLESVAAAF